jgi:predicted MFS family arabinose efflux permease
MSDPASGYVRRLALANSLGGFDRFVMAPLLVTVSVDLGASLVQVSLAATVYYFVYGGAQPFWAFMSGRFGRGRTLRVALLGGALAAFATAAAPSIELFVLARALSALSFAAIIPISLIYLGEAIADDRRQAGVADLLAGAAIGMTVASLAGGLLADVGLWRALLAGLGVLALLQAVTLRAIPAAAPVRTERGSGRGSLRWGVVVLVLAAVNSSVALAALSYVPVAVEGYGEPARLAGFAVAWYGIAYWAGTRVVKPLTLVTPVVRLVGAGGLMLASGLVVATASTGWPGLSLATALVGFGFAFTNSSLQRWVIEVAPGARQLYVSLFTTVGWVGGAIATAAVAPLADGGRFSALFGGCAVLAGVFAACAPAARARWQRSPRGLSA